MRRSVKKAIQEANNIKKKGFDCTAEDLAEIVEMSKNKSGEFDAVLMVMNCFNYGFTLGGRAERTKQKAKARE